MQLFNKPQLQYRKYHLQNGFPFLVQDALQNILNSDTMQSFKVYFYYFT